MDTFSAAYLITAALLVTTFWLLLFVDVVGPGLRSIVARIVGRTRDRKLRRAQHLWHMQRLRVGIDRWHAKYIRTDPRTDRS